MSARLRELIEKRNRAVAASRAILEAAEKEDRSLTTEEQTNFDRAMADQEELRKRIDAGERQAKLDAEMASSMSEPMGGNGDEGEGDGRGGEARSIGTGRYAINLADVEDDEHRTAVMRRSSKAYRNGVISYVRRGERRALDASSSGANGSYLVAPIQMAQGLLQRLDDTVFVRAGATVFPLPFATSLGRVSLETDAEDGDWTDELNVGGEEDSTAFGRRDLTPHPLAKFAKISNRLVRISTIDVVGLLLERLRYKFALTEEKAFLTGDGNQKPLGIFTASNAGIPVGRDVATGNAATSIKFEGLLNAKYSLKSPYLRNARWIFSRPAISQISQLRDDSGASPGTGQFLWQPSTQLGQPDRIHGIPVEMSEHVPAVFTSGKYVGAICDLSFYHIADALDMQIQRLNELFALKNQTGLVCRKETDGMPVLAEAFARVKLG